MGESFLTTESKVAIIMLRLTREAARKQRTQSRSFEQQSLLMSAMHEDYHRKVRSRGPSDRGFGWVFTAAFLFFGTWPLRHGKPLRWWCLVLSGAILLVTLIRPSLLHAANVLWMKVGVTLGKVVNPLVTGLLFYLVFTPGAVILRWIGKDLLGLAFDREAKSYWVKRDSTAPESTMINQF